MNILRAIFFPLFFAVFSLNSYSQSSNIKSLSKFERGIDEFNIGHYNLANEHLISSRDILEGSNLKIQYYLIRSFYNLEEYKRCRTELELYFDYYEGRAEQSFFYADSIPKRHLAKRDEMIKLLDRVDEKINKLNKVSSYDLELQETLNWIKTKVDEFGIHSNKYIYNTYEEVNKSSESKSGGLNDLIIHGKVIRGCLMSFDNNFNVTIKYELKNRKLPMVYKFSAKDVMLAEMKIDASQVWNENGELKVERIYKNGRTDPLEEIIAAEEKENGVSNGENSEIENSNSGYYFLRIRGFSDQTNKFCLNWDIVYNQCVRETNFMDLMLTNDKKLTQRLINAFNHIGEMNNQKRLNNKPSEKF